MRTRHRRLRWRDGRRHRGRDRRRDFVDLLRARISSPAPYLTTGPIKQDRRRQSRRTAAFVQPRTSHGHWDSKAARCKEIPCRFLLGVFVDRYEDRTSATRDRSVSVSRRPTPSISSRSDGIRRRSFTESRARHRYVTRAQRVQAPSGPPREPEIHRVVVHNDAAIMHFECGIARTVC